jgi:hypothetical protein
MEAEGAESDVAVAQLTAQLKEARLHAEGVLHAHSLGPSLIFPATRP